MTHTCTHTYKKDLKIYSSRIFMPGNKRKLWTTSAFLMEIKEKQTLQGDQSEKGRDQP